MPAKGTYTRVGQVSVLDGDQILLIRCRDRPGILAKVTSFLYENEADIRDAAQYGDPQTDLFFVRIHFRFLRSIEQSRFEKAMSLIADDLGLLWTLHDCARPMRVMLVVSRAGHCLYDLLHRWQAGALPIDIVGVVSNHDLFRRAVEWHGLPFHHLPLTQDNRSEQERRLLDLFTQAKSELLVLARYMQILSPSLCESLKGRCINIHHSFLPSFKGAKPYHKAHAQGVKLIGATAHYVTADLDEGPIIEQDVRRVSHRLTVEDLIGLGRETEASVLARAVKWHAEHRIMLNGRKTVVFS